MVLSERGGGLEVIFGKDPSSCQAKSIGIQSGVPFTEQEQVDLYRQLRIHRLESDQVIYAMVLEQTNGPVDVFEAAYPQISFPSGHNKF